MACVPVDCSALDVSESQSLKVSYGDSTDNLPKGIYVVGGRKVVVR